MIRVRFPNGQTLTYNDATVLRYKPEFNAWEISSKDSKGATRWYASVQASAGVLVEGTSPCRVENPMADLTVTKALELALGQLRGIPVYKLRELKRALAKFDARKLEWV